ncbi:MAG TPA: hypothetical protein H9902_07210 [Candidatus Stackebrandtia faecavium]|nr:hypothetical protein [Candidatus Stackebrandtia faecavium]
MSFPGPPPASFLPPSAPKRSRSGGFVLLLAGIAAVSAIWLPWVSHADTSLSLKEVATQLAEVEGASILDNPTTWFYSVIAGAALAILFGLVGVAGNKGVNICAGIFGLMSVVCIGYPPMWALLAQDGNIQDTLDTVGVGFYVGAGAGVVALIGSLVAFAGAART